MIRTRCSCPVLIAVVLASCATAPPRDGYAHVAAFWLKPQTPAAVAAELIAAYRQRVGAVAGVRAVFAGRADPAVDRAEAEHGYDVLTIITFDSEYSAARWQSHPLHDELRQRFTPHVARIVVYDAR